ncbi:MAG: hypothetical protein R2687_01110 [Candidatus Nanopelagicales bacterium]
MGIYTYGNDNTYTDWLQEGDVSGRIAGLVLTVQICARSRAGTSALEG